MSRTDVDAFVRRLHEAQHQATELALQTARHENLADVTPEGFTVQDVLRMWVWHFWTHHRDLIRARGALVDDNPPFHVPHFVRQANEAFGHFVGELACLNDDQLDLRLPDDGRSIREIVEHVLETLTHYTPDQIARASPGGDAE